MAVGSFRVRPRRHDLRWPSIGVLVTVLANGVVGGIAVRGDLHPALVQSHFLLAMVSIAFGLVAIRRARPGADRRPPVKRTIGALALGRAAHRVAIVTGTVVTGTGPHAGEEDVRRFGSTSPTWRASTASRCSSPRGSPSGCSSRSIVTRRCTTLGSALTTGSFARRRPGGIGYVQYFNERARTAGRRSHRRSDGALGDYGPNGARRVRRWEDGRHDGAAESIADDGRASRLRVAGAHVFISRRPVGLK